MKIIRASVYLSGALVSSAAVAADLPSAKGPPIAPPPAAFSWQGGYVGVYAGALLGDGSFTFLRQAPQRGAALVGGGAIGYNLQWTPTVVLGVEADFGYRGPIQSEAVSRTYPGATDAGILGTFRARAGYAFTPRWLVYGTAGLAYGTDFAPRSFTASLPLTFGRGSTGTTVRPGWTAGGGVEYAWSDRISVKVEYLYAWLADSGVGYSTNFGVASANVSSAGHIVRGGLNYRFTTGGTGTSLVK
ncbi:porin family protein [Methylosinus sp. H3A]|uniref:outer membrane protein n=1 Tax=Methylosinus sp. H3A TaxID=2785786 RepID=UPI0018C2624D|nr:outer membrane beta-barrel protein [Methylosinus sp. H3A]MBG0808043.1 porin family protein [Methylosinus sp. H3A]